MKSGTITSSDSFIQIAFKAKSKAVVQLVTQIGKYAQSVIK